MLTPGNVQVWVATEPTSMLKSIDGLVAEVEARFSEDAARGHIFVFVNRQKTAMKLLYWSRGGFVVTYKRLETERKNEPLSPSSSHLPVPSVNPSARPVGARLP